MVVSDRSKIDPALLPTLPRAAFYHSLYHGLSWVYHEVVVWKDQNEADKDPLHWRWKLSSNKYGPIMMNTEAGPSELLKIIRCGCKGSCGEKCFCKKPELKCRSTCKECHGVTCTNVPYIVPEENQINFQRSLLDAFEM